MDVIDVPAAETLRMANPVDGEITLYHGSSEEAIKAIRAGGIKPEGLDDGVLNVTIDPAIAARYTNRYGGTSPRVAVIKIPEGTFQDLFGQGLIKPHDFLPNSFKVTEAAMAVINKLLGH